jgi:hypothetical protein
MLATCGTVLHCSVLVNVLTNCDVCSVTVNEVLAVTPDDAEPEFCPVFWVAVLVSTKVLKVEAGSIKIDCRLELPLVVSLEDLIPSMVDCSKVPTQLTMQATPVDSELLAPRTKFASDLAVTPGVDVALVFTEKLLWAFIVKELVVPELV